jgi:hypothetical protein
VPEQGIGPAHQHQKGGLKGILGRMRIAEQTPAHPKNHRPMPAHQEREGGFLPLVNEGFQQFAVRAAVPARPHEVADGSQNGQGSVRHSAASMDAVH